MRILFLHPTINRKADEAKKRFLERFSSEQIIIDFMSLDKGPAHMDLYCHEVMAGPEIIKKVIWANRNGYNAIVIDCFMEPGLHPAREVSKVPVIGPFESSISLALQLGHKFSVLSFLDNAVPQVERQVRSYGVESRLASIRTISTPVLEFGYDTTQVKNEVLKESRVAIENDRAEVIVLGCTLLFGLADDLMKNAGVPVIDPLLASFKMAESIVTIGLPLSKKYLYKKPYRLR
jgi:allantoin racemase